LIQYVLIDSGEEITIWKRQLTPYDLHSQKTNQFGFILFDGEKKLVFLWDEAISIPNANDRETLQSADWLLCEAYCIEEDAQLCKPHEKAHITALEAWNLATSLEAKNLILSHVSDYTDDRTKQREMIQKEAQMSFSGSIVVPDDNEKIVLW
jgi:ribonuclease Z